MALATGLSGLAAAEPADEVEVPEADLHAADECPAAADLNRTTRHYHALTEERVFRDSQHAAKRKAAGLAGYYGPGQVRELTTRRDARVCTALNEHHRDRYPRVVPDHERDRHMPSYYNVYYQAGSHYVVIMSVYSPGSETMEIGPPSLGRTGAIVYDRDLNKVGSFGM